MPMLDESQITRAILDAYHEKLSSHVSSDVIIVGAGPAGLVAAYRLARRNLKVAVLEKRLSPGGGIWGGAMGLNEAVVQQQAVPILDELGVRRKPAAEGLTVVDAVELAAALCLKAVQAGAAVLNLVTCEDLCVHQGRVCGVVANRSMISPALPVDPVTMSAKAVLDATGHEAMVVDCLRKRKLLGAAGLPGTGEGPMDADRGEAFVVERVAEIFPGLWVAGMSVCAVYGGPRMGPIFGGMLLSGARAAELIAAS